MWPQNGARLSIFIVHDISKREILMRQARILVLIVRVVARAVKNLVSSNLVPIIIGACFELALQRHIFPIFNQVEVHVRKAIVCVAQSRFIVCVDLKVVSITR